MDSLTRDPLRFYLYPSFLRGFRQVFVLFDSCSIRTLPYGCTRVASEGNRQPRYGRVATGLADHPRCFSSLSSYREAVAPESRGAYCHAVTLRPALCSARLQQPCRLDTSVVFVDAPRAELTQPRRGGGRRWAIPHTIQGLEPRLDLVVVPSADAQDRHGQPRRIQRK